MPQRRISCSLIRGGTSKGLYFLASDLPQDEETRDAVLLAAMGSPDQRQIDGLGGAHPLTSKVAVVSPSARADADIDYLFIQVTVDEARVSTAQNCGNILAGVAAFAIETGIVQASIPETSVIVHMVNTGGLAKITCPTPDGLPEFEGDVRIDGVPGTAAPVMLEFLDVAGSSCGALLPTGSVRNLINDVDVTMIDNGMPVVLLNSASLGKSGTESPEELEANTKLCAEIEAIRIIAGQQMGLGDVSQKTVPKMCLVSPPMNGGIINTRTFIPKRVHEAIGVLGAVSVATACAIPGSVAAEVAMPKGDQKSMDVEHPTGFFSVAIDIAHNDQAIEIRRAALLRTARVLMRGEVCIPSQVWREYV